MTSIGLNKTNETRANEQIHSTVYLPTPDFLWNLRSNSKKAHYDIGGGTSADDGARKSPLYATLQPLALMETASPTPTLFTIIPAHRPNLLPGNGVKQLRFDGRKSIT